MPRSLFTGAPELSRLFTSANMEMIEGFATREEFATVLCDLAEPELITDDKVRHEKLRKLLANLRPDRLAILEMEACRISAMAESQPDEIMRRLQRGAQFTAYDALNEKEDAEERSLWAYLNAEPLFVAAERATQVRLYRDNARFYEAWVTEQPVPATAADIDKAELETEISGRLQLEEGCSVETVDLPETKGSRKQVLVAVMAAGPYSSQKTIEPDRTTRKITFRPANELLLIYTPSLGKMEVCARDPVDRRTLARVFAASSLKEDLSNKPLSQKVYDLSRFRSGLSVEIPESHAAFVRRAAITKVEFRLSTWTQRLTLQVDREEDIDAVARRLFGDMTDRLGSRLITSIEFSIAFFNERQRKATLRFTVSGKNRSTIQSERDASKRALGYDLLEAWGVMRTLRDLTEADRPQVIKDLLNLLDMPEDKISGDELEHMKVATERLIDGGFLRRTGWDDVVLLEDDDLGPVVVEPAPDGVVGGEATLTMGEGEDGARIETSDISRFAINHPYIQDEVRQLLAPLNIKGRMREIDEHLHHLGSMMIRDQPVPVFLARGHADDEVMTSAERLIRAEKSQTRGIVLVPKTGKFPFLGAHVVIGILDHLAENHELIDRTAIERTYLSSRESAGRADAPILTISSDGAAAQLSVPGQDPKIIVGPKRVRVIKCLFLAHLSGEVGVKRDELQRRASVAQMPQSYGAAKWKALEGAYIHRPKRGVWALLA